MAIDTKNLVIGAGEMTLKGKDDVAEVNVGATTGAEFSFNQTTNDVFCDQSVYPIFSYITKGECTGKITMLEATMRNMIIALGGDPEDIVSDTTKETYTFKADLQELINFKMVYKTPRIQDKTKFITVTMNKVQSTKGLTLTFNKEKENTFSFEFKALVDSSTTPPSLGSIAIDKLTAE